MGTLIARIWFLLWMMPLLHQLVSSQEPSIASIGQSFYLPGKDLLEPFTGGPTIFKSVPEECIIQNADNRNTNDVTYYENSNSFYQQTAREAKIGLSLSGKFSLGVTLSSASKSISYEDLQVAGTSINVWATKDYFQITQPCLNSLEFTEKFINDLEDLPLEIPDPFQKESWGKYQFVLEKYGSHILQLIRRGSRLSEWTFAKSSKKYTERDFIRSGCMSLSKVPTEAGLLGVNACSNYSKEEINSVSEMTMSHKRTVFGGKVLTRSQVQQQASESLITKFMAEAQTNPNPIFYEFSSIWDVLMLNDYSSKGDNYIRAKNMKAYYEGYLDLGCSYDSKNGVILRRFVNYLDGRRPHRFICQIAAMGCRNDDDCHIGGAGSVCYCHGSSCVDSQSVKDPSSKIKEKRIIRKEKEGSYKKGINKSCYYKNVRCKCNKNRDDWDTIWSSAEPKLVKSSSRGKTSNGPKPTGDEAMRAEPEEEQQAEHDEF